MGMSVIFIFFFGFVFLLVALGAVLGFLTALYAFRPRLFTEMIAALGHEFSLIAKIAVGLFIAIAAPLVGGLAYAVSGTRWFVELFGLAGTWFWLWVAISFALGLFLGCILRHSPSGQSEAEIANEGPMKSPQNSVRLIKRGK